MEEGRLGAVRRQQDYHRKSTIVMNDLINFQQNVYTCFLKREQQNTQARIKAQEVYLKRSIVRNSYLLQCLEARKQKIAEIAPEKQILGRYGGRPIHAYSRDVDACMSWMHPRLRRLRRVERAKEKGRKLGAIMDFSTIPDKMEEILQKQPEKNDVQESLTSKEDVNITPESKHRRMTIRNQSLGMNTNIFKIQPRIYNTRPDETSDDCNNNIPQPPVLPTDETTSHVRKRKTKGTKHEDDDDKSEDKDCQSSDNQISETKNISEGENTTLCDNESLKDKTLDAKTDERSKVTGNRSQQQPPPLVRRPTLILPPIKTTKEMKVHGFDTLES